MKKLAMITVATVVTYGMTRLLLADEVTPEQAQTAVRNWVRKNPYPMTAAFPSGAGAVETLSDESGQTLCHVVRLDGGGFVVTSGDTKISPVVAFSDTGSFAKDARSPLFALLKQDMVLRRKVLVSDTSAVAGQMRLLSVSPENSDTGTQKTASERAWEELLREVPAQRSGITLSSAGDAQMSDVRVAPLLKTDWGQAGWGDISGTAPTFNYYTPGQRVCGCVATAGAQIMKRWEFPSSAMPALTFDCRVNGQNRKLTMKGGTYNWSLMTEVPTRDNLWTLPDKNREAIGRLTYDVGVASEMNYTDMESGTQTDMMVAALKSVFGYKMAFVKDCKIYRGSALTDEIKAAIYGSLDAGMPVSASLRLPSGAPNGGHSVVFDGYGYIGKTMYTHINCGWAMSDEMSDDGTENNIWYDVMGEGLSVSFQFHLLNLIGYNIHPTKSGDVFSGRVLTTSGAPVAGARVTLTASDGRSIAVTDTNVQGIWCFFVNEVGTYGVTAKKEKLVSKTNVIEHQKCSSTATYMKVQPSGYVNTNSGFCGNKWGVDLRLESEDDVITDEPEVVTVASPVFTPTEGTFTANSLSVTLSCGTSGATIRYTTDGSEPTSSSPRYSGTIRITGTTSFKARAFKNGMADSAVVSKTYTKVIVKPTITPAQALDWSGNVTVSDSSVVCGQDENTHDGEDALALTWTQGKTATASVTVVGPGTLSFWWAGSVNPTTTPIGGGTESSLSYFSYRIDGGSGKSRGGTDWRQEKVALPAGTHTIEWSTYRSLTSTDKTSFIDEVVFTPWTGGQPAVSFNANGAEGTLEVGKLAAAFGTKITLPGSGSLVKTGYLFCGWAAVPDAVQAQYEPGTSMLLSEASVTLYAVWKPALPVLVEIPQAGGETETPLSCFGNSFSACIALPDWAGRFQMKGRTSAGGSLSISLGNGRSVLSVTGDLTLIFSADANDTPFDRSFDLYMDAKEYPFAVCYQIMQKADVASRKVKGIVLEGAASVVGTANTTFSSRVVRRNGEVSGVTPVWSVVSGGTVATISAAGQLTAKSVASAQEVVVRATYEEDGIVCTSDQAVTILPSCDLAAALGTEDLKLETGTGAEAWYGLAGTGPDGRNAVRASSALGGTPWFRTVVTGPASVSFDCLLSADNGNVLYFVDNGVTNLCAVSVEMTIPLWQRRRFTLKGEGEHVIEFVYCHEGGATGSAGGDAAWIAGLCAVDVGVADCTIGFSRPGWHVLSFNALPEDRSVAAVFGSELAKVGSIADMGSGFWTPQMSSGLEELRVGEPYWINTTTAGMNLIVSGTTEPDKSFALKKGWNRIGYCLPEAGATAAVLNTALTEGRITYIADDGSSFHPNGGLTTMSPGKAYWVYAPAACTITYDFN